MMASQLKVFITGGTGFLGSHIVMQLLAAGHEVTILAREPERVTGFQNLPRLRFVKGLITDYDIIADCLKGQDACIHTVLNWGDTASEILLSDTLPAVKLFEMAAELGVKQCIFTSSTAALGEYRHSMHEEMKSKPVDHYGAAKAATENFMLGLTYKYPIRCNIVRPGRIIGRSLVNGGKDWTFPAVPELVGMARRNETITVMKNDGTQLISGYDLARIYLAILLSTKNREIYFGLGKHFIDREAIARKAVELLGSKSEIVVTPNPFEESPKLFELSKIEQHFGFVFDTWPEILGEIEEAIRVV